MSKDFTQTQDQTVEASQSLEVDLDIVEPAIRKTQAYLLSLQSQDGYWVGELEADA